MTNPTNPADGDVWLPIESAPRDGSVIELRFGQDGNAIGWWRAAGASYIHPWQFIETDSVTGRSIINASRESGGPSQWRPYKPNRYIAQHSSVQGELDRIVGMIHETVNFLESCTVFVNSRERIKRPEGSDMWDQAMVDLATIASLIADLTPAQKSSDQGSWEVKLGVIRQWPEGMLERLDHVFKDLIGFTIDYKLYDVMRVLKEFGFEMKVFETSAALTAKVKP